MTRESGLHRPPRLPVHRRETSFEAGGRLAVEARTSLFGLKSWERQLLLDIAAAFDAYEAARREGSGTGLDLSGIGASLPAPGPAPGKGGR